MIVVENQAILVARMFTTGEESEAKKISILHTCMRLMSEQHAVKEAATIHATNIMNATRAFRHDTYLSNQVKLY